MNDLRSRYHTRSSETLCRSLEQWSAWNQRDIDDDKTIVETVNALIAVAAFIAGIQSGLISFTMTLPQDAFGTTTNSIAFVGLILDVVGTFLGVIHAIVLQRRIKQNTTLQRAMHQVTTSLRTIHKTEATMASAESKVSFENVREPTGLPELGGVTPATGLDEDTQQQIRKAHQLCRVLEDRFKDRSNSTGPFNLALGVLQSVVFAHPRGGGYHDIEELARSVFGLGHTPLLAMGLGVVSLIVSTIMFASASTQLARAVWISCVSVLGGVVGLSLLPITYEKLKSFLHPESSDRLPV